jgi:AcrR family transcriptional regulator
VQNFTFVTESAKNDDGGSLRERKRAATRASLTAVARSLTARHGLNGFTVDQVCEEVGISRRTFFNYFPSKEDAIVGHFDDEAPEGIFEAFVRGGAGSPAGTVSPTLLQDLFDLTWALSEHMTMSPEQTRQLIQVIGKEPQLLVKIIGASEGREADFAALIAEREGIPPDHPVAVTATAIMGSIARRTSSKYFSTTNTRSYHELLLANINAARELFSQQFTSPEGSA